MDDRARELIATLQLTPHPEGGYYREVFRDPAQVPHPVHRALRSAVTHIHFLLVEGTFSAFHRVAQTELWHHVEGASVELTLLAEDGEGTAAPVVERIRLGRGAGCRLLHAVPPRVWQAAVPQGPYALMGCTVAPGFSFDDFELASPGALAARFPSERTLVEALCIGGVGRGVTSR